MPSPKKRTQIEKVEVEMGVEAAREQGHAVVEMRRVNQLASVVEAWRRREWLGFDEDMRLRHDGLDAGAETLDEGFEIVLREISAGEMPRAQQTRLALGIGIPNASRPPDILALVAPNGRAIRINP